MIPSDYTYNKQLRDFYEIDATSRNGSNSQTFALNSTLQEYIAVIHAKNYPFYGVQFHPEYTIYENFFAANKSKESIEYASALSRAFINIARQNNHAFPTIEERNAAVSFNTPLVHVADSSFSRIAFFPRKKYNNQT